MKSKTFRNGLFLFLTLGLVAYLDSPFSFLNINYAYMADQPVIATLAKVDPPQDVPVMEEKLEKSEKVDGYIVETYQEFEVYRDQFGKVTKRVPTSKTETLKYWAGNK
jgi:hypothetical protein